MDFTIRDDVSRVNVASSADYGVGVLLVGLEMLVVVDVICRVDLVNTHVTVMSGCFRQGCMLLVGVDAVMADVVGRSKCYW